MRLELLPVVLGALALALGALGGLLAWLPALRRRWPRLGRGSLLYAVAGALLLASGLLLSRARPASTLTPTAEELVTVTFESDPSGAEVFLGARSAGYTPLSVRLPRGVLVPYRVEPGERVLLPGRFASYAGAVAPQQDTRLAIWLDRLE